MESGKIIHRRPGMGRRLAMADVHGEAGLGPQDLEHLRQVGGVKLFPSSAKFKVVSLL